MYNALTTPVPKRSAETQQQFDKRLAECRAWFDKLDSGERECVAFEACGCEVAYPTWWLRPDGQTEQVDCSHLGCRIRRGEFKRPAWLVLFTAQFRGELRNGWLRFCKDSADGRRNAARLYWAQKKREKFDIMSAVYVGVWS